MLAYLKSRHGQLTVIDVEPEETRSCIKKKNKLLDDISEDISINIQNNVDKSTEINSIYHELNNKQMKDSVLKEVKDDFELLRKRSEILETQLTTRVSQLERMMYNTVIKQTEQRSRELDEKKLIFCVNSYNSNISYN